MTANDCAVGSKGGSLLNQSLGIDAMHREMGTGRGDIGEDTRRTTEDIVLYLNSFIYRHVVLDANSIADADIIAYVDILTKTATAAKNRPTLNMTEMPYLCAIAYRNSIIDITRRMDKIFLLGHNHKIRGALHLSSR